MANVILKGITKVFGDTPVVDQLDLAIEDGEFVVLVGPSGCGKSTTLRMIAGLEEISAGSLKIGQKVVNELSPKDRDIAMVFQNYALYAHMTVYDNIAFGLKLRKKPKAEIRDRVLEAARVVGMTEYLTRKPGELSGGQRQRVALARAIVRQPGVFLFDEPLSNLDAKLRVQMRLEIARLQRELGTTTIYVTHDQVEAMTMADRIAVLDRGVLQQFGRPMELYNKPANIFVASFIGSPAMNFFKGILSADGVFKDRSGLLNFKVSGDPNVIQMPDQGVILGVRPEDLHLDAGQPDKPLPRISGQVQAVELMGNESIIYVDWEGQQLVIRTKHLSDPEPGDVITLFPDTEKIHFFSSDDGKRME